MQSNFLNTGHCKSLLTEVVKRRNNNKKKKKLYVHSLFWLTMTSMQQLIIVSFLNVSTPLDATSLFICSLSFLTFSKFLLSSIILKFLIIFILLNKCVIILLICLSWATCYLGFWIEGKTIVKRSSNMLH